MEWAKILGIISATFVSEDLTCVSTGLLIRSEQIHWFWGGFACVLGIFVGDLGLFYMGKGLRYGLFTLPSLQKYISRAGGFERMGKRFHNEGWKLVLLARFVPGLRLPVYVTAGFIGGRASTMVIFALLAGLLWTPALVAISAWSGPSVIKVIEKYSGGGWFSFAVAALVLYLSFRVLAQMANKEGRRRWAVRLRKLVAIEFWPPFLFYMPLLPGCIYWIVRYLGFHKVSSPNPGIAEGGGIIGESKASILKQLPKKWILDWLYIPDTETFLSGKALRSSDNGAKQRLQFLEKSLKIPFTKALRQNLDKKKWSYPVIMKPDKAQRGVGVKLVHDRKQAQEYLRQTSQPVLVQVYDPGPLEAGVLYYRLPNQKRGEIFSITDKVFPVICGDGKSTVEQLIWAHRRYRMQGELFVQRFASKPGEPLSRVLKKGELFALGMAGNHAQGTMFKDGSHLYSEALRERIESIAQSFDGFYFGRFDIRYKKTRDLKKGKGFRIVELNGTTSESTNIYDPSFPILRVYRTLYRQWDILCRIAHQNYQAGAERLSLSDILRSIFRYKKIEQAQAISD